MQPKEVRPNQLRHHWEIYFFIIPTLLLIALFQYYPASSGIFHSLFRWNGSDISEFVGFENYTDLLKNLEFWNSFKLAFILGFWNVIKMIPALLVAVSIHRCTSEKMQFFYRTLFVVPMVIPGLITVLIWRSFFFEATAGYLNQFLDWTGLMTLLQHGGNFVAAKLADPGTTGLAKAVLESFDWLTAFKAGSAPAWLGDPKIIIIACVVWGFPWVGSFAVLTHLAKLQNISKDIYEAADIDGANWWTRFTKIELPLLMGSIYLLLVFAIIDTIKDAGMILALAGITGGPGGKATVPALFMLRKAFMDQQMGYACAVGIVLTVVVLLLQKICNMLLQGEPEGGARPGKSAWFGILALYTFAEGFVFFRAHLVPHTATPLIFAAFVVTLLIKLGLLVSVPVALRKYGRALRHGLLAVAAGLMAAAITGRADVTWLLFGYALVMMLSTSLFKAAIGVAGAILIGYGATGGSLNMIISGAVFIILATPWGQLGARVDKAYLARCLRRPTPAVSKGDLYVARSFARQQMPAYKAAAAVGSAWLRFAKHAFIWFVLAFAFLPLYLMLIVSLKDNNQFYLNPTTLTQPLHWDNWSTAWAMVSPTVANSIFLSTTATFFIVIFGLAGAYFFARLKVPLSSFLWNALLLLMMMPMIANLVPLFILLRDMSLLNTLTALILVGASGGQAFAIFVFRNFIADIPQDLFEAAEIDGANHFQQLKLVVIPLSGPIMGTVAVMQFLGQWNEFVMPLIVMREQARLPVTVQLIRMAGEYIKLWGPLMAGYAIASIPVIILFTFSMKLFVKGLTEGAVKG
ncbi:MAG TPA: ABC transporter permease subunit [Kiritimatiellia bacterium]|jgi:ABC-type glycerol-3-phosphate transport system permease component|nr:ABC transporter permease subunit [Kiritimatiellia bacterium]OQC58800.1 MAG: Trehalose transport system permease protein SugB [Verrucomicrobia bacterium ADurb.Bin018]MBP9571838.1 ABC transporter permease subunit [Kiritimatiellia bacterium]HOD99450.1 ABC transporter permease subunit [Kiritimatiellia bacterium]HOE36063.1 ABC transporter permease subunit [Kiritimatiellia bacterium]